MIELSGTKLSFYITVEKIIHIHTWNIYFSYFLSFSKSLNSLRQKKGKKISWTNFINMIENDSFYLKDHREE